MIEPRGPQSRLPGGHRTWRLKEGGAECNQGSNALTGHQGSLGRDPDLQRLERELRLPSAFPDGVWGQRGYCGLKLKEV